MSSQQEDGDKAPAAESSGRFVQCLDATASAQLVSTSGRAGPPSELATAATPASYITFLRTNLSHTQGGDAGSLVGSVSSNKKKRGQRAADADNRGLRQCSIKVCEKVASKGRTTYGEVADELVAESSDPGNSLIAHSQQQNDDKNIRRRVYDALNVLIAMDIITKDKGEIQWKGLPHTSQNDSKSDQHQCIRNKIEKKAEYLRELEEQFIGWQNLIQRNEQLYLAKNAPIAALVIPFILVQTQPCANIEIEISEDSQLVYFDFQGTPFELHDDNYVLKAMQLYKKPQSNDRPQSLPDDVGICPGSPAIVYQPQQVPHSLSSTAQPLSPLNSPPISGILKAQVRHEDLWIDAQASEP